MILISTKLRWDADRRSLLRVLIAKKMVLRIHLRLQSRSLAKESYALLRVSERYKLSATSSLFRIKTNKKDIPSMLIFSKISKSGFDELKEALSEGGYSLNE